MKTAAFACIQQFVSGTSSLLIDDKFYIRRPHGAPEDTPERTLYQQRDLIAYMKWPDHRREMWRLPIFYLYPIGVDKSALARLNLLPTPPIIRRSNAKCYVTAISIEGNASRVEGEVQALGGRYIEYLKERMPENIWYLPVMEPFRNLRRWSEAQDPTALARAIERVKEATLNQHDNLDILFEINTTTFNLQKKWLESQPKSKR